MISLELVRYNGMLGSLCGISGETMCSEHSRAVDKKFPALSIDHADTVEQTVNVSMIH